MAKHDELEMSIRSTKSERETEGTKKQDKGLRRKRNAIKYSYLIVKLAKRKKFLYSTTLN